MITGICSATDPGARDITEAWKNSFSNPDDKLFVRDSYAGCVLETYEHNGYDDSDFYAIVWDEASQSVKTIEYATTRGWCYCNSANIDASPEVREKARVYYVSQAAARILRNSQDDSKKPAKGKPCIVVKGRKIAKGTQVLVVGNPVGRKYSLSRFAATTYNVLVRLPDGSLIHTNVENLQVVNPEQYVITTATAAVIAEASVGRRLNFRSMGLVGVPAQLLAHL